MNVRISASLAGLFLAATFLAPAHAAVSFSEVNRDVQNAIVSDSVDVKVTGNTVILSGAADAVDKLFAERAVRANPDVDRVINHITGPTR